MMQSSEFTSKTTKDHIKVAVYSKSHRAHVDITRFDELTENIKLLGELIDHLKKEDVKWIVLKLNANFTVPQNAIWYQNKKTGDINCHIEDFEKIYLANLDNLVKPELVFINYSGIDNEGWVHRVDKKKIKAQKLAKVKTDINAIATDWTQLS